MNLGDLVQFYGSTSGQAQRQPQQRSQFRGRPQYQVPQQYNQPYPYSYVSDTVS